jgi:hypothetical protein
VVYLRLVFYLLGLSGISATGLLSLRLWSGIFEVGLVSLRLWSGIFEVGLVSLRL